VNDPASTPAGRSASADLCAVLVVDQKGRIVAANRSAGVLWSTTAGEMIGRSFASLFAFEVTSSDPDFLEAQWEVVLASALDRDTALSAQPNGLAPAEVTVRLEANAGGEGWIAAVRPKPAASATPPVGGGADASRSEALDLLASHASAGFFDLHLATGSYRFSPAWKKILGYTAAELPDTLETWHRLIHPDDSGAAPDQLGRRASAGGAGARPFNVEFRMQHRLGHWVWVQCLGVQIVGADGVLQRVIGLHLDITERKELEEASLANDARLQDLSGGGPLAASSGGSAAPNVAAVAGT
jgi:PAS domain S-box-containing protein